MFVKLITAKDRYLICKSCESFQHLIKICSQCGCFMPAKVTLAAANCPLGKWVKSDIELNEKNYNLED